MSVLSSFLSRDALAAAAVALVMAGPAGAASMKQDGAKAAPARSINTAAGMKAAKPTSGKPLNLRVAPNPKEDEARLLGVKKAYDGLFSTRDLLYEGTRVCMKDQRWLLMKVRDSFYDDGTVPSERYLVSASDRLKRAVGTRQVELSASKAAAEAPSPERDPTAALSREAQRAGPSDIERLRSSVDRLHGLRSSCLRWAERTVEQVSAAASAPMETRLERIRQAQVAAERDYRSMQDVSPDSAREALASMDMGSEPMTLRVGSL